ncbi:hypothetical protein BKA56DRAFT_617561 [Ilyonectria sp. MPI-CAGE-AT-0026]|nr:hypothetical protein BKA56DRAFT_617561 [Ilyonectria sp. MPI-CAGE-AT-0026]
MSATRQSFHMSEPGIQGHAQDEPSPIRLPSHLTRKPEISIGHLERMFAGTRTAGHDIANKILDRRVHHGQTQHNMECLGYPEPAWEPTEGLKRDVPLNCGDLRVKI